VVRRKKEESPSLSDVDVDFARFPGLISEMDRVGGVLRLRPSLVRKKSYRSDGVLWAIDLTRGIREQISVKRERKHKF